MKADLVITNPKGMDVTTSVIVSQVFQKRHADVLRDIENIPCSPEFRQRNFAYTYYVNSQNKTFPMFEITKDGFSFLALGYTGVKAAEFKEKFIAEFNRRGALLHDEDFILHRAMAILKGRTQELEAQNHVYQERIAIQEVTIQRSIPKVSYYNDVLQSDSLISTNVIAKELGMSAKALNKILNEKKIIYRSGSAWVLYALYQGKGLTRTKTYPYVGESGEMKSSIHTYWTERGRKFIHNLFNPKK